LVLFAIGNSHISGNKLHQLAGRFGWFSGNSQCFFGLCMVFIKVGPLRDSTQGIGRYATWIGSFVFTNNREFRLTFLASKVFLKFLSSSF